MPDADRKAVAESVETIWRAAVPRFATLLATPSSAVKARALLVLAGRSEDSALAALDRALGDDDEKVVRAALAAVEQTPGANPTRRVTALLASSPTWAVRVAAAQSLGAVAKRAQGNDATDAQRALAAAAKNDAFAFVREASLRALVTSGAPDAKRVAADIAAHDADPQLRERAAAMAR